MRAYGQVKGRNYGYGQPFPPSDGERLRGKGCGPTLREQHDDSRSIAALRSRRAGRRPIA